MALKINPIRLSGPWQRGWALDQHTVSSEYFADRNYGDVTVFFSGTAERNNISNWPSRSVAPRSKRKDFSYYLAKDLAMTEEADFGFMLWDGESKGTLNNILNLIERGKYVVVYYGPDKCCVTVRNPGDLDPMLRKCSEKALETFETKIDLGARLEHGQRKLSLA